MATHTPMLTGVADVNTDEAFAGRGRDLLARMEEWNRMRGINASRKSLSDPTMDVKQVRSAEESYANSSVSESRTAQ